MIDDAIEDFWEYFASTAPDDIAIVSTNIRNLLDAIDPALIVEIRTTFIQIPQSKNQVIPRYQCIISTGGCVDLFPLAQKIRIASSDYEMGWQVVSFMPRATNSEDLIFVSFQNSLLGISTFMYCLTNMSIISNADEAKKIYDELKEVRQFSQIPLNQMYDLVVLVPDDLADSFTTQDQIYELRDAFMQFLESILGEYTTALCIRRLTLMPNSFAKDITQFKNGAYLQNDLLDLTKLPACKLCGLHDYNVELTHKHDELYCDDCFELLNIMQ